RGMAGMLHWLCPPARCSPGRARLPGRLRARTVRPGARRPGPGLGGPRILRAGLVGPAGRRWRGRRRLARFPESALLPELLLLLLDLLLGQDLLLDLLLPDLLLLLDLLLLDLLLLLVLLLICVKWRHWDQSFRR